MKFLRFKFRRMLMASSFLRTPRSRGRSRFITSLEDARLSLWFTCWGSYMLGTQETAGKPEGQRRRGVVRYIILCWRLCVCLQGYHHQKQRDHTHVGRVHPRVGAAATPVPGKDGFDSNNHAVVTRYDMFNQQICVSVRWNIVGWSSDNSNNKKNPKQQAL